MDCRYSLAVELQADRLVVLYPAIHLVIPDEEVTRPYFVQMLLNIGPTGDGHVPLMSRAIMDAVGYWMSIYGKAIYNGRPYIVVEGKRDFILRDIKDPKTFYLFKYNLGMGGDTNVALDGGAAGIVEFDGFEETAESVRWLDDGADLNFEQNGTNIKIGCNNFRYGKSHCVRVAEIKIK